MPLESIHRHYSEFIQSDEWVLKLTERDIVAVKYTDTSYFERAKSALGYGPIALSQVADFIEKQKIWMNRSLLQENVDPIEFYRCLSKRITSYNQSTFTQYKIKNFSFQFIHDLPVCNKLNFYSKITQLEEDDFEIINFIFSEQIAYIHPSELVALNTITTKIDEKIHEVSKIINAIPSAQIIPKWIMLNEKIKTLSKKLASNENPACLEALPADLYYHLSSVEGDYSLLKEDIDNLRLTCKTINEKLPQSKVVQGILDRSIKKMSYQTFCLFITEYGEFIKELDLFNVNFSVDNSCVELISTKCKRLIRLNLDKCYTIITPLKNILSLRYLTLSYCVGVNDTFLATLEQLTDLKMLKIVSSSITDNGLKSLQTLKYLDSLKIEDCEGITDIGIELIKPLVGLRSLSLSGCKLVTDNGIRHLAGLINLEHLDLGGTGVTSIGLQSLRGLTHLQSLSLVWCNSLNMHSLTILQIFINLRTLNLAGNVWILPEGFRHVGILVNLTSLDLSRHYRLTDQGLEMLQSLNNLQFLNLDGCRGITDNGIQYLQNLIKLRHLNLNNCTQITNKGLSYLKGLTQLQKLDLQWCNLITGWGLRHLQKLKRLESLDLCQCTRISNRGLSYLRNLKELKYLNLHACEDVSEGGLYHLKGLYKLKSLCLSQVKISDSDLAHLRLLNQLESLSLDGCDSVTVMGVKHLIELPALKELTYYSQILKKEDLAEFRKDIQINHYL